MKTVKYILASAAALMLASCTTDVEQVLLNEPSTWVAPKMAKVSNVVVNKDNSDAEKVVFSWTAADFGQPVEILYSVYLKKGDTVGLLGTTNSTTYAVTKGDLNGVVMNNLGVDANQTEGITAYVTAALSSGALSQSVTSAETPQFNVTTYAAPLKQFYICGAFNGGWDIDNAPMLWETGAGTNTYAAMIDFSNNPNGEDLSYFKIVAGRNWSGDNWGFNYLTPGWGNLNPDQPDSNLSLSREGGDIWAISVNTVAKTIDAEQIGKKVALTGSFDNWGDADVEFQWDYLYGGEGMWVTAPVALAAGDEVKIRCNDGWDINWGASGKMSTAIPGGIELGKGAENIKVAEAGNYVCVLHANRKPYVLELVKQ